MMSLEWISLRSQNEGYIWKTQFSCSVTGPTNINLCERDGTNKVFDKDREGDKTTSLAPMSG